VYTDGSYVASDDTSAWAVAVQTLWLENNFDTIPPDERLVQPRHVRHATLLGSAITNTSDVYPAELQAIARVLSMLPLRFDLTIRSDSQAALAAIRSFDLQNNHRKRLRMAGRALLQLISKPMNSRKLAGGSVQFEHVRAHSSDMDIASVGNRLADYQANASSAAGLDGSTPLSLSQLPLEQ
jgi:ribonuclease HI